MTLTATLKANNSSTTGATSNTTSTFTSPSGGGRVLVVLLAANNAGTSGASSTDTPTLTLGGVGGYSLQSLFSENYTPGSTSNDGVTLSAWYYKLSAGANFNSSNCSVTFNFSTSTSSRAWQVWEVAADSGLDLALTAPVTSAVGAGSNTSTPTRTSSSVATDDLVIGVLGLEAGSETITADSDTTRGTWSAGQTNAANTGTNSTSMTLYTQRKPVTSAGTQTFNPTLGSARDLVIGTVEVIHGTVPGTPGIPTITSTASKSVAISWTAPSSAGGAAISDYTVQYSTDGSSWTTFVRGASTSTSVTVTGLTNGTPYVFRVTAVNSYGSGSASAASAWAIPLMTTFWFSRNTIYNPLTAITWNHAYYTDGPEFKALGLSNAGNVTTWPDEISTADATYAGSNIEYLTANSRLNYQSSVGVKSGTQGSFTASVSIAATYYIFIIANVPDTADTNTLAVWGLSDGIRVASDQFQYNMNGGSITGQNNDGLAHMIYVQGSGATSQLHIDGNVTNASAGTSTTISSFQILGGLSGVVRSYHPMAISFVGITRTAPSAAQRADFRGWAQIKYGTP